jgi:hypothetical protein
MHNQRSESNFAWSKQLRVIRESWLHKGIIEGTPSTLTVISALFVTILIHLAAINFGAKHAGVDSLDTLSYARWDSGHYLSIADIGYFLEPCEAESPKNIDIESYIREKGYVCGNVAWFPLYSYSMRWVRQSLLPHLDYASIGVLLSLLFRTATIGLFLYYFYSLRLNRINFILSSLFAGVLGALPYFVSIFPLSHTLFLGSLAFLLMRHGRTVRAAICCFLACLSYSTGWMFGFAFAGWGIYIFVQTKKAAKALPYFLVCGSGAVAVLSVFALQELQTGEWKAFLLNQAAYRYTYSLDNLLDRLALLFIDVWGLRRDPRFWSYIQSLTILLWLLALIFYGSLHRAFKALQPDFVFAILCLSMIAWFLPNSMGNYAGLTRSETLFLPTAFLFPFLPRWVQISFLIAFLLIAPRLMMLFFNRTLI